MDGENFMESFKAKDVFYYLDCHIKDLSKFKNNLDEKTYNTLENNWERYAYEHHLGRDILLYELQSSGNQRRLKNNC